MTVRKKLILSNILMICIPAIFALTFGVMAFKTQGNRYWEFFEVMYRDENGAYSAQSIVNKYQQDLAEGDWCEYVRTKNGETELFVRRTAAMTDLENDLSDLGYRLSVKVNGDTAFGTATEEDEEKLEEYSEQSYGRTGTMMLSGENFSLIKNTFESRGQILEIAAVRTEGEDSPVVEESYFRRYVVSFVVWMAVIVGAVVVLTNVILSIWNGRMIMRPLRILKEGTKKIADGDLDWQLDYHKKDEFGEVCGEFDRMRGHLKESVETRLQYEQYRKELIIGISHDLRTPLTSIKGYAEGLQDGIADTEEKRRRYYDAIHIRAMDMEALVDSLSLFARLEHHHHQYQLETVDMKEYMENLLKEYEEEARQKQLVLMLDCPAVNTEVKIDVQEMRRVFINLFENSVKYRTKDKSVVRIVMEDRGNYLEICTGDDGPGVMESELSKIFNTFYRADESRTKPGTGSGLGLSIAKQIVEGHGGTIYARNHRGLEIVIQLPLENKQQGDEDHAENTDRRR